MASDRYDDWIKFAGTRVRLACERTALDQWWRDMAQRGRQAIGRDAGAAGQADR
jgi:hypothetical protein